MTEITRDQKIAELAEWGYKASNTCDLSDSALTKLYQRFFPPITEEQVDKALEIMIEGN